MYLNFAISTIVQHNDDLGSIWRRSVCLPCLSASLLDHMNLFGDWSTSWAFSILFSWLGRFISNIRDVGPLGDSKISYFYMNKQPIVPHLVGCMVILRDYKNLILPCHF